MFENLESLESGVDRGEPHRCQQFALLTQFFNFCSLLLASRLARNMLKAMLFFGLVGGFSTFLLLSVSRVRSVGSRPVLVSPSGLEIQSLVLILVVALTLSALPLVAYSGSRVPLVALGLLLGIGCAFGLRRQHFRWLLKSQIVRKES